MFFFFLSSYMYRIYIYVTHTWIVHIAFFSFQGPPENGPGHDRGGFAGKHRQYSENVGHGQVLGHEDSVFIRRRTEKSRSGRANHQWSAGVVLRRDHDRSGQLLCRTHGELTETDRAHRQNRHLHAPPTGVRRVRQAGRGDSDVQRPVGVPRPHVHGQTVVSKVRTPSAFYGSVINAQRLCLPTSSLTFRCRRLLKRLSCRIENDVFIQ